MTRPTSRDELIAMYGDENGPSHGLNSIQNSDDAAQQDKLTRAIAGELGLTSEDRLSQYLEEEFSGKSGLAQYPAIGVPATVVAAIGGGLGVTPYGSDGKMSGTPSATPNTYTTSDGYTFRKVGNTWTDGDMRFTDKEFQRFMHEDAVDQFRGTSHSQERKDWHRNQALQSEQRRLAGFGSAAQTEAARAAKQAKSEALRATSQARPDDLSWSGPQVQSPEERPLWQQREKHMREYRRLKNLHPSNPERTSFRTVSYAPSAETSGWAGDRRVTKMQDVVTKIQAIDDEIARIRNISGIREPAAIGLGTGRTDFGHVGYYPSGTEDDFWRAKTVAEGDADVAFRKDIERRLNEMRRYFNQSAIARELAKVPRVPTMAGGVSRGIPGAQALALIAEPLMLFAHKFDDPSEGTFGISFGTQLKSMAATLTQSTGEPTPLKIKHLAPEAIQRLRDEPETAHDLYNFGAISEEVWEEVKPKSGAPISGE